MTANGGVRVPESTFLFLGFAYVRTRVFTLSFVAVVGLFWEVVE